MKKPFVIQFEQLSIGIHEYEFNVDLDLFKRMENSEFLDVDVVVEVELNKTANMMDLNMDFDGKISVACDRCNEPMSLEIHESGRLVAKYGQTDHQDLDDLVILDEHEHEINLEQFLYENISLMIPARHVHEENECDPEIIEMLEKQTPTESDSDMDPRWEKLKKI